MSDTLGIVGLHGVLARSLKTAAQEKKARRRDAVVLKRTLEASRLEYLTRYRADQANAHASRAPTKEEEQALLEEARALARIEERVRAARARARRRVRRCGAAQSPVDAEVRTRRTQQRRRAGS